MCTSHTFYNIMHIATSAVILLVAIIPTLVWFSQVNPLKKHVIMVALGSGLAISHCCLPANQANVPSVSSKTISKQLKKAVICPICSDAIEDAIGKKKGQCSIYCDGNCQEWIHRQCAGLSKAAFQSASSMDEPFHCP